MTRSIMICSRASMPSTSLAMVMFTLLTASSTPLPRKRLLLPSRSSSASREPVEAPDGTAARPSAPPSRRQSTSIVGLPRESRISRAKSSTILNMARALYTAESGMPQKEQKPSITVLYDAQEKSVREEELADGKKVPRLVCHQIEDVLSKRGYKVKLLDAEAPNKKIMRQMEDDTSDLIFNVCESLGGAPDEERRIAALLELLEKRFTGSGSLALTLAGDKSLAKKLFDFHGVKSPDFVIIAPGRVEGNPSLTPFPLIVKPTAMDASIGIDAKSVVHSVEELMDRVLHIHNEFHNPALVEQYIDGREIYVSMIGNPPVALPPIEWDLSKLPPDLPRIAGTEAKWDNDFKAAREFVPKDVTENEEVMQRIGEVATGAWNALLIRDYARIDMRLAADGTPYVIEVNPNPWLDNRAEFAMAARRAKPEMSHGDVIERIVELAMAHPIRERSAI